MAIYKKIMIAINKPWMSFAKGVSPDKYRFRIRIENKLYGSSNTVLYFVSDAFKNYKGIRGYFGSETRISGVAALLSLLSFYDKTASLVKEMR